MENERKKLMEAALAEFVEIGPARAGLDSIAARAGLEESIARALFVDKQNLLKIVLEELTDPIVSAISVAVEKVDDPRAMIRDSVRLLDLWLQNNPAYSQLIRNCVSEGAETLGGIYEKSLYPSEFFDRLDGFIKSGRIRERDLFMVCVLLDSLIFFPHMMMPAMAPMLGDEKEADFHRRRRAAVMNLLEHGLLTDRSDPPPADKSEI